MCLPDKTIDLLARTCEVYNFWGAIVARLVSKFASQADTWQLMSEELNISDVCPSIFPPTSDKILVITYT